jgi:hypothetical protein
MKNIKTIVIDQSGASLDQFFRKSSKMADEAANVHFRKRFAKNTNEDLQITKMQL